MNGFDAIDGERVASNNASRRGDGDGLIAVVNVENAASANCGRLRNVTNLSAIRGNGGSRSVCSAAVGIVELIRLEAGNGANIRTRVSVVRLGIAKRTSRNSEVVRHAVVIAARQSEVTITSHDALLVHDAVALSNVIIGSGCGRDRNNERALSSSQVHDGQVDVRSQLLLGGIAETTFLKRVTQFQCVHLPGRALVETES